MVTWFGLLMDRLRTQYLLWWIQGQTEDPRVLWWLQGLDEDNKDSVCGNQNRLRTHTLMWGLYG